MGRPGSRRPTSRRPVEEDGFTLAKDGVAMDVERVGGSCGDSLWCGLPGVGRRPALVVSAEGRQGRVAEGGAVARVAGVARVNAKPVIALAIPVGGLAHGVDVILAGVAAREAQIALAVVEDFARPGPSTSHNTKRPGAYRFAPTRSRSCIGPSRSGSGRP